MRTWGFHDVAVALSRYFKCNPAGRLYDDTLLASHFQNCMMKTFKQFTITGSNRRIENLLQGHRRHCIGHSNSSGAMLLCIALLQLVSRQALPNKRWKTTQNWKASMVRPLLHEKPKIRHELYKAKKWHNWNDLISMLLVYISEIHFNECYAFVGIQRQH